MKKVLFLILILSFYTYSFSQTNFGLRIGMNMSDYTNLDTNKRTNFYVGAILPIQLSSKRVLQPEINFSKQGAIYHIDSNTDYNLYSDFISGTVLFKYTVLPKTDVFGGPYIAVRVNKEVYNDETSSGYFFNTTSKTVLFMPIDSGITMGIEYNLFNNFTVEARYIQGMNDSIELRYFDSEFNTSLKETTQVFQLGIAYKLELKQTKNK